MIRATISKWGGMKPSLIIVDDADKVPKEVFDTIEVLLGEDLCNINTKTTTGTLCEDRDRKGGYLVP